MSPGIYYRNCFMAKIVKHEIASILIALGLLVGLVAIPAQAVTEEEIELSIEAGLDWLVPLQNLADSDSPLHGSWGDEDMVARTGLAVLKLESHAFETGKDPFDAGYEYSQNVAAGLNYLFSQAVIESIEVQPAGNPDSEGDGSAISIWYNHRPNYETSIAMMAIAASRHPEMVVNVPDSAVDGWTYQRVVQNVVDYFAWAQCDAPWNGKGGWWYNPEQRGADNSNTGYVVLGLRYAEAEPYGFECTIPGFVKSELNHWINYIQNDQGPSDDGDCLTPDGGSGYTAPWYWVNLLKTGNLLLEMAFVGDDTSTPRVQDAIGYIERHWNDPNSDPGWRPHYYQAMYCLMKGFESLGMNAITIDGNEVDWFDEFSTAIVDSQNLNGSWPQDIWGDEITSTEWALLTLERVAPPPSIIEVEIDIKPGSWPNSINPDSKGVIPVAILTTDDFDATTVDPDTVAFGPAGATAVRYALEDVDDDDDIDIILHFKTQEVGLSAEDTEATLTGQTFNGQRIKGTDAVRIAPPKDTGKGKAHPAA